MSVSIIPTKIIIPRRPDGVLRRPRLIDYLHENLERKLILITAPAGYGKTTLLIDFAQDADMPICWYTLDEGDRDLAVFLAHLLASLQRCFPDFGQRTRPLVDNGVSAATTAAAALVADIASDIPDYFSLVLDDWHLVSDEGSIRDLLDHILRYLPDHAHLVVAGRTLLRGPLVRLAAQGAVAGIGAADLRFTGDEVRDVLATRFNLSISDEQAARFAVEAEGWITAILLTSSSVWQDVLGRLAHVRDSAGTLYEYLASEVFDRLEAALQDFLLASAVPRQFTAELYDDLCGGDTATDWIDQVEARNLFLIRLEDVSERWYRYHHLFREFLLTRLQRQPGRFEQLQLRAGELFEARQQPEEAVEHFLAAHAPAPAARLMQSLARRLFISGQRQTLRGWVEQLPTAYRSAAPELLFYHGQALIDRGQLGQAVPLLKEAEAGFAARGDRVGQLRATLPRGWENYARSRFVEAHQLGQQILQDPAAQHEPVLMAEALRLVGDCEYGLGQWSTAETLLTRALGIYRQTSLDDRRTFNLGRTLQDLANVLRSLGRLEEAATLQSEALTVWRQIGNPGQLARCLNNLGYDRYVSGDYDGALKLYAEALARAEEAEDRFVEASVMEGIAAVQRDGGEVAQAVPTYQRALSLANELGDLAFASLVLDGLGHTHRLRNEPDRAMALFEQARSIADREGLRSLHDLFTASIGIAHIEQGQVAAGLVQLVQTTDSLRAARDYLHLGRNLLWLGYAQHQAQDFDKALLSLSELVRLGQRLGCRPFPDIEGRRALAFLIWGADRLAEARLCDWLTALREGAPGTSVPQVIVDEPESPPHIEAHAFGQGQIQRDGRVLTSADWGGSALARELFFFLLEQSPQRKDEIGAVFWPTLSLGRMTSSFHAVKYKARRALGVEWVAFANDGYHINPEADIWYDVAEFKRLLVSARARSADDAQRIIELQQAAELYTAPFLSDDYEDWAVRVRERLQAQYFELVHLLIDAQLRQNDLTGASVTARRGLEFDYYREDLHRVVLRCLAITGQKSRAVAHYDKMNRHFVRDLNTQPGPETLKLVKQIRSGQPVRASEP